jgi:hypothetical protein
MTLKRSDVVLNPYKIIFFKLLFLIFKKVWNAIVAIIQTTIDWAQREQTVI